MRQRRGFTTSLGQRPRTIDRLGASAESATRCGATSIPHVTFVIRDTVFSQEPTVFFRKGAAAIVFLLRLQVLCPRLSGHSMRALAAAALIPSGPGFLASGVSLSYNIPSRSVMRRSYAPIAHVSVFPRLTLESASTQTALRMNARSSFPANKRSDDSDLA